MGLVILSAVGADGARLADWKANVELQAVGTPAAPATATVKQPAPNIATWGNDYAFLIDGTTAFNQVNIKVTGRGVTDLWPLEGQFAVAGDSLTGSVPGFELTKLDFGPVGSIPGAAVTMVVAHLSRLRDASDAIIGKLNAGAASLSSLVASGRADPDTRIPVKPMPDGAQLRERETWHVTNLDSVGANALKTVPVGRLSIRPAMDVRVLELAGGASVPKLVAVVWPDSMKVWADEVPFVVLIRNRVGTTRDYNHYENIQNGSTSDGWGYLAYGFYQWLSYQWDPLVGDPEKAAPDAGLAGTRRAYRSMVDTRMGFAYQLQAAAKKAVVILPLNRSMTGTDAGHGEFLRAGSAHDLLREIAAFMLAQRGLYPAARVGRTAYCGFSSGHLALEKFIRDSMAEVKAKGDGPHKTFFEQKLCELYFFDPPTSDGAGKARQKVVEAANDWAQDADAKAQSDDQKKMIRLYCETHAAHNNRVLLQKDGDPMPGSYVRSTADGRRTVAVVPTAAWLATSRQTAGDGSTLTIDHHDGPHPLFAALFLKDALERSGFTAA